MTALGFAAATVAGVILLGKLLLLLVLIAGALCTLLVCYVANDIWKSIRIDKERRGYLSKQRTVL